MAGSITPELVAAVNGAGALGSFGAAGSSPVGLRSTIREIRTLTDRPFHINLFSPGAEEYEREARPGQRLSERLATYHAELKLGAVPEPISLFGPAAEQLDVLLDDAVPTVRPEASSSHPYRQTQHPPHATEKLNESRDVAAATLPPQNVLKRSCPEDRGPA
jgi:NAD(P)H-dependent flavin oxidoreductase YrpB (nitropropane dioxygenase family)